MKGARPVSQFLKVQTRVKPPDDDEIMDALTRVLDDAPALAQARLLLLRADEEVH